jgi:DNA-binding NtrC family response regulator
VRELQNVIERAVIVSKGNRLRLDLETASYEHQLLQPTTVTEGQSHILTETEMRELERQNIEAALKQSEGRIYGPKKAACLLEIPATTLTARINKMGINRWSKFMD